MLTVSLKTIAMVLGAVCMAFGAAAVFDPARAVDCLRAFPRNRAAAWVLTAVALLWSAVLLFQMPMERFEYLKPLLYFLTPAAYVLIVLFVDDLLAARALGGLLVLLPAPMLAAARFHASPWRFTVVILAYLMAVCGIVLILGPYYFRRAAALCASSPAACRWTGALVLIFGALLFTLGLVAY